MLKTLFKSKAPQDKARYEIEKSINQDINKEYQNIEKLNKRYDEITTLAEKQYESQERQFVKDKSALEASFDRKRNELKITQESEKKQALDNLTHSKKTLKEQLEALKLDHKKSIIMLENDLETLKQEKELTLKEIERKYLSNTSIYEDKLQLFKKNLSKNQEETKNKFEQTIKTLEDSLEALKSEGFEQHKLFETNLEAYQKIVSQAFVKGSNNLDNYEKDFLHKMNQFRKELNVQLKNVDSLLSKTRSQIEAPFFTFGKHLQQFSTTIKGHTSDTLTAIEQDFIFESARTEKALAPKKDQDPLDAKQIKDIKARLKLAELRKNTLIEQLNAIERFLDEEVKYLESSLDFEKTSLTKIFNDYETLIKEQHNAIKDIFSTIENYISLTTKQLSETETATLFANKMAAVKLLVKEVFDGIKAFEIERLKAHINFTKNTLPLIQELDDITIYLDTVEPLKEIEISRQKIKIEQEDASIKLEIQDANLTFELTKKIIDHELRLEEQTYLNDMTYAKEEQNYQDLLSQHQYNLNKIDIEEKSAYSDAVFALRENHFNRDIELTKARQELEKEKLQIEKNIKLLTMSKDYQLSLIDLERETEEATVQHTYEIEQLKLSLNLMLEKKRKLEERFKLNTNQEIERFKEKQDEQIKETESLLKIAKKNHQEKIAFINRALEKETEQPLKHIKEIKQLVLHRVTLLKDSLNYVQGPLLDVDKAISNPESSFKLLLPIVGTPFIKTFEQYVKQSYEVYKESLTFIHEIKLKQYATEIASERKRQQLIQKENSDYEKIIQKADKDADALKQVALERIQNAKTLIQNEKNATLQSIRVIIKPLCELLLERANTLTKQISTSIKALFAALYQNDETLINRAKENHQKAYEQEVKRYENEIKPYENKTQTYKESYEKSVKEFKEQLSIANQKDLESIEKEIALIRENIQSHMEQKNHYLERFKDKEKQVEYEYKEAKVLIDQEFEQSQTQLEAQTKQKVQKLLSRLDDAKNILNYEQKMHQNEIEHLENLKQEAFSQHEMNYEAQSRVLQSHIDKLKSTKEGRLKESQLNLDKRNTELEELVLSSLPRLDQFIEEASRKVDQEASLKRQQFNHILDQLRTQEATLNAVISDAIKQLELSLVQARSSYDHSDTFKTQDALSLVEPIVSNTKSFVQKLIDKTIEDIIHRD
ncbi:hypothetical protein [Liberiplasma polymorphum]|uniref:hypothetical protein n=1 Tax=Liberiplasma polymorphum TaxID=3374570 RepID=UPI003773B385